MKIIKNASIRHKMLFPNVLYAVLLGVIAYFFVNSNSLIKIFQKYKGNPVYQLISYGKRLPESKNI